MKKIEIMNLFAENEVKSTNVKSFINKNKALKLNYEICLKWLKIKESKESEFLSKKQQTRQAKQFGFSVKKYIVLKEKSERLLNDFFTGHSMGCYRTLSLIGNRTPFATNNILSIYSKSYKFKPSYGEINIILTKKELENIENIAGVWTIKGKHHAAKWLESRGNKQSYSVNFVSGYLFADIHGKTLKEAKDLFGKRLVQLKREKLSNAKFVGYKHLKEAGACDPGINSFIEKHKLNKEYGYNLGYLKSLEYNSFLDKL